MKELTRWYSPRLECELTVARWGHWGQPVLLFPTAGGDAEEIERMLVIDVLRPLIDGGRIKVFSMDSIAGRAWADKKPAEYCIVLQNRFDACVAEEVVPAIRNDCQSSDIEIIAAGASIGAFNAMATLCRHPDVFRAVVALSGSYDLERLMGFHGNEDFYFAAPLLFLPNLGEGPLFDKLRQRFALLAFGKGRWENPQDSWRMAEVLGSKGIPNRVDAWGEEWDHDWPTWRHMLPQYLDELTS